MRRLARPEIGTSVHGKMRATSYASDTRETGEGSKRKNGKAIKEAKRKKKQAKKEGRVLKKEELNRKITKTN